MAAAVLDAAGLLNYDARMEDSSVLDDFVANCKDLVPAWLAFIALAGIALAVFSGEGLRERYREPLGRVLSGSTPTA